MKRLRIFCVGFGERVVENFAELQGARPTGFLDPSAGIRKHTDVDAVFVHNIEVLSMVESVKARLPARHSGLQATRSRNFPGNA